VPDFTDLFEFCEKNGVPVWFACDESRRNRLHIYELDENLYVLNHQASQWFTSAWDRILRARKAPLNGGPEEVQLSLVAGKEPLD